MSHYTTDGTVYEIIPFAMFRYNGEVITLNERQFKQAVADGRICRCKDCLACRALEYYNETRDITRRKTQ